MDAQEFLQWEAAAQEFIKVKTVYIDITNDLVAGVLLSKIITWNLPKKDGSSRLTVHRNGRWWLAKKREDWWDECRITPKQYDRAADILMNLGLIVLERFHFNGLNMVHLSLNIQEVVDRAMKSIQGGSSKFPKGKVGSSPKGNLLLKKESTAKITYSPIVPVKEKDVAAEDATGYTASPPFPKTTIWQGDITLQNGETLVIRGNEGRLDAASRPRHNMVDKGESLLGEAEGDDSPHPRDNSEHPQSELLPQDKTPELDSSDRGKTKKTRHIEEEAQEVLAHLNRITGKRLTSTGLIPARLKEGRTVAECTLVLDWMLATWSKDYADRSVNYETPFRARKFELYLDSAQRWGWTQQPKTLSPPPSPTTPGEAVAIDDDFLAMMNAMIPERSPRP